MSYRLALLSILVATSGCATVNPKLSPVATHADLNTLYSKVEGERQADKTAEALLSSHGPVPCGSTFTVKVGKMEFSTDKDYKLDFVPPNGSFLPLVKSDVPPHHFLLEGVEFTTTTPCVR